MDRFGRAPYPYPASPLDCLAGPSLLRSPAVIRGQFPWPVSSANWRRSSLQTLSATPASRYEVLHLADKSPRCCQDLIARWEFPQPSQAFVAAFDVGPAHDTVTVDQELAL